MKTYLQIISIDFRTSYTTNVSGTAKKKMFTKSVIEARYHLVQAETRRRRKLTSPSPQIIMAKTLIGVDERKCKLASSDVI
jgi:hypothetical protein